MEPRSGREARIAPLFQRDKANARQPLAMPRTDLQNRAKELGRQALQNALDPEAMPLDESRPEGRMKTRRTPFRCHAG